MIVTALMIQARRKVGFRILAFLGILLAPGAATLAQTSSPCVDASSPLAIDLRHRVGVLVSLSDTISTNQRASLSLPALADNQVTIVTDTAVCRTASLAYDSVGSTVPINKPVVVLALGTQRLVIKEYHFGEWLLAILFNQTYTTMVKRFGL